MIKRFKIYLGAMRSLKNKLSSNQKFNDKLIYDQKHRLALSKIKILEIN